jgi:hypothetical protein
MRAVRRTVTKCGAGGDQLRMLSSNLFSLDLDDDLDTWPRGKANTVLNICPQGEEMVVERLGKLYDVKAGGYFFSVPFIDSIRFVVDMREKALLIMPQAAITKDNVHVKVSGNIYCQFNDSTKAAYGSKNPIYAVKQHAMASMRAAIGEMELDEILHARKKLNVIIREVYNYIVHTAYYYMLPLFHSPHAHQPYHHPYYPVLHPPRPHTC